MTSLAAAAAAPRRGQNQEGRMQMPYAEKYCTAHWGHRGHQAAQDAGQTEKGFSRAGCACVANDGAVAALAGNPTSLLAKTGTCATWHVTLMSKRHRR